jgi:hypothetical protein
MCRGFESLAAPRKQLPTLHFLGLDALAGTRSWLSWMEHHTTNLGVGRSNRSGRAEVLKLLKGRVGQAVVWRKIAS